MGSCEEIFAVEKLREAALGTADSVMDAGLRRATPTAATGRRESGRRSDPDSSRRGKLERDPVAEEDPDPVAARYMPP